jgi:hypothetical protein
MAGYIGSKASVVSSGAERKKVFDITTTTTSLTGCSYTPNQVHVYHNGVRLVDGTDYTATNGSTVTLTTAAQSGDEVVVISYATFQTSDTVSASAGGTFSNAVTIDADGATVLTVDRATSDGTIIDLQKDGSSVGGIGASGGNLEIKNSSLNLYLRPNNGTSSSSNTIWPQGNVRPWDNNTFDLGSSVYRWKDAYLSGGVYLGGTGSANYLDDYEEGLHTVVLSADSGTPTASSAEDTVSYTKVGDTVLINGQIGGVNCSGCSGVLYVSMPFVAKTLSERSDYYFVIAGTGVSSVSYFQVYQAGGGGSDFRLTAVKPDGTRDSNVATLFASAGSFDINLAGFIYKTT